jgi:L-threonylcarbamoyladenylate synthase
MENLNEEVHKAYEVIKEGGIILYPTDTVWELDVMRQI